MAADLSESPLSSAVFTQCNGRYRRGGLLRVHVFRSKSMDAFARKTCRLCFAMDGE